MLAEARRHTEARIELVEASADELPFADGEFHALTFTYLLRYVDDPAATLRELARVVRPGGTIAGLEFGLPQGPWRPLWELHVRGVLPARRPGARQRLAARSATSSAPRSATSTSAGRSSGSSRRGARPGWARSPHCRSRSARPSSPGARAMTEEVRPSFYALRTGGWRDYVTILHLPYTAWNLAYVAVGASLAPVFRTNRMLWTMAAFALALGVSAHALDELNGRPLQTRIPDWALIALAAGLARRRVRDRRRAACELGLGPARIRRGRCFPRARLQPRVVRRADPQPLRPRARLGRVPDPDRLLRPGRRRSGSRPMLAAGFAAR